MSTWAGLRPLVANWRGKPSDISRAHVIRTAEPGWWDIAGGKLTTYRLDGRADGRPDGANTWAARRRPAARPPEPLLDPAKCRLQRHCSAGGRAGRGALLPPRMGRAFAGRDDPPHRLASLSGPRPRRWPRKRPAGWPRSWVGVPSNMSVEMADYQAVIRADQACCR